MRAKPNDFALSDSPGFWPALIGVRTTQSSTGSPACAGDDDDANKVGLPPSTRLICPSGGLANSLSSHLRKNISLRRLVETALLIPPSHPSEGRIAIVTDAGWDAMDVAVSLTNDTQADGEVVWS
jgi:hypothetical protein